MQYLRDMAADDLRQLLASLRADFERREERAKDSGLRSDRALADEAYTTLDAAKRIAKERGIDAGD